MTSIEIGTGLPTTVEELAAAGVRTVTEAARHLEDMGFESLWLPDLILGDGTPALEPALALAAAAAVTERVRIGFGVLVVPLRPAPWLAAQVATLQHLSGDRLLLGVGSGGFPDSPFWRSLGVSGRDRGRTTDATLALLPRLLSGEPVEIAEGEPSLSRDRRRQLALTMSPKSAVPPILVGGSERAFHRVLAHGDAWFPSLIDPAGLAGAVTRLREMAAERGVPAPGVTVGGHLVLGDDESARSAHEALVRTPMTARTPEELAELFAAYRAAGADRIVAGPDNGDWRTQLDFMADAKALLD
ncbi:MAG: LLM class flavin-dependent oxidoreductase [Streptosporangiales bacterium]|nr:LLM class flavin-dependent oxidoreductase [Streptosporangiales bacterium]